MMTTTMAAIRSAVRTAVQAITPTHPEYATTRWVYTDNIRDVLDGAAPRTFALGATIAEREGADGMFGGGVSYSYGLSVVASYTGIAVADDEALITEDAEDIYEAIRAITLDGFIDCSFPRFGLDRTDDGQIIGTHELTIRYFGRP
jgi:hypothetical protein